MNNYKELLNDKEFVSFIDNLYKRYLQGIISYSEYLKHAYK